MPDNDIILNNYVSLGHLNEEIVALWAVTIIGNLEIVLTTPQRLHFIEKHPDIASFESWLSLVVVDPDEVHKDKFDPEVAIFYRSIERNGKIKYYHVAVAMQIYPNAKKHSVLSFRFTQFREIRKGRNEERKVWEKK